MIALLLGCGGAPTIPPGDATRPDVVVISLDTVRADHLGAYGYGRATSPGLDALAAGGVRFAEAWSPAPWTLPAHATILSSVAPPGHGAIEGDRRIDPAVPWLPEAMRAAGYATIAVTTTLYVSDKFGFDRGFDSFDDFDIANDRENLTASPSAADAIGRVKAAVQAKAEGKPAFVFLHLYDAHYPYAPPAPYDTRFDRSPEKGDLTYKNYAWYQKHPVPAAQMDHQVAQYDEEIAYLDDQLAALRDAWARAGRRAVWVIVADHGEEFGERGSWGHAHTLWPEQLHVPWIVAGEGVSAGIVAPGRVGLEDVAPTIAGWVGVPFAAHDGVDRSAVLRGGADPGPIGGVYAETSRFATIKARYAQPPLELHVDLAANTRELCDRATDVACLRDVARERFDDVTALEQPLWARIGAPWTAVRAGRLESDAGVFVVYGKDAGRAVDVQPGTPFALVPLDAPLRFRAEGADPEGPWQALGGQLPDPGAPVAWSGSGAASASVGLSAAEQALLESIGYVQKTPK